MIFKYSDFFDCELPPNWCADEKDDNLLLYNPNGHGAITMSFFNVIDSSKTLAEQVSILGRKFIIQNNITLHSSFILMISKDNNTILYGTGSTLDNWFVKIWVVAKHSRIALASYCCSQKSKELKTCDSIIDSIHFIY